MSWLDMVIGVSQVKTIAQYFTGDLEGAKRTNERFVTKTPIVAHLAAGLATLMGRDKIAEECWKGGNSSLDALPVVGHVKGVGHYVFADFEGGNRAMVTATSTTMNMMDSVPVVGHVKGAVHYAIGDDEGGFRAMVSATRSTTVVASGAGGFLLAGPFGATTVAISMGTLWDGTTAVVTNHEDMNGIFQIVKNPTKVDSYFEAALAVVSDGLAGYAGGKMAERVAQASQIRTAETQRAIRAEKGFPRDRNISTGKAGREIFSEVTDTRTGKTYTGVNEGVRKAYSDPAPRPNKFIQENPDIKPPMNRLPSSCAEAQALHKYVVDQPGVNPSTVNIRINSHEVKPNGEIYTAPRCENCMAYKDVVGKCDTDGTPRRIPTANEYLTRGGAAAGIATTAAMRAARKGNHHH